MRGAAAAIVPHDAKFLKSQMLHHFHLVLSHGPLGIGGVIVASRRLAAVSVSPKIRHDEKIILSQCRRDFAPEYMSLRDAMKEQQGGAFVVAAENGIDRRSRSLNLFAFEAFKKFCARFLGRLRLA